MSVAPLAPVSSAPPAQAVAGAGDVVLAAVPAAGAAATAQAGSATPQPATPVAPPDPILQAVDVARAAAAGRQASLAPLLADLAQAIASPNLSGQTKAAIAQVLALQTPTGGPFTATVVREAVTQSGLFLEAHLARPAPSGPAPPDLKAALLVLQRVLATASPAATQGPDRSAAATPSPAQAAPAPPKAPGAQAASPSPVTPAGAPAPAEPISAPAPRAEQTHTPAAPQAPSAASTAPRLAETSTPIAGPGPDAEAAPRQSEPASPPAFRAAAPAAPAPAPAGATTVTPATESATASAPTAQAPTAPAGAPDISQAAPLSGARQTPATTLNDAQARDATTAPTPPLAEPDLPTLAPPNQDLPLDPRSAVLFLQRAFGAAPGSRPAMAARTAAPPPPLRQGATGAQAAQPATLPDGDEATIAQHLAGETDQALARLTLHQLASLPDVPGGPAWMFELPLATPQGAAMAQFVIEHDDGHAAGGGAAGPSWRARFSIDVEPLGPVHVHLRMGAENSAVTLWAEREGALARLRGQGSSLAQALGADVVIHPGAPGRSAPPGPGQFVDQSS